MYQMHLFVYKSDHAAVLWLSPKKEHVQVNIFFKLPI